MAKLTEVERTRAAELYAQGKSVNAVAKELFKGDWARAKKAQVQLGGASEPTKPRKPKKRQRAIAEADEEEPENWDLTLEVATGQLDAIWALCSAQEKATALQTVLQARLEAA